MDGRPGFAWLLIVKFVLGYVVLHILYFSIPVALVQDFLIPFGVVLPCAALIDFVAPAELARAVGYKIVSPRAVLEIVRGCDGAGSAFLLLSAVLTFPAKLKQKLLGLALALGLVYVVNQLRVVGLYFIVAYHGDWFATLHSYFVPLLVIGTIGLFYAAWVQRVSHARMFTMRPIDQ